MHRGPFCFLLQMGAFIIFLLNRTVLQGNQSGWSNKLLSPTAEYTYVPFTLGNWIELYCIEIKGIYLLGRDFEINQTCSLAGSYRYLCIPAAASDILLLSHNAWLFWQVKLWHFHIVAKLALPFLSPVHFCWPVGQSINDGPIGMCGEQKELTKRGLDFACQNDLRFRGA